ncbi:hypothetical protein A2752_04480 [Candidatus Uhrbacteria bacterium RIFCSPHIGHO2_01_FULL_46_23]|uniref:Glycosyltransferase 2-like domain-containing protein n=1 Tax=Candidatus Beckwithbacteria bacterium RIFCSPHIGHO2_12_FULL_47_17 TaxID=1797460 RepID=A0A1F5DLJ3_9BACT|nr:MAG: hypothetical protein A3E73_02825 [Candidatus Beckwithbacteria bacterium RIFCSPHIGHO2_12_FULL_47_17]OGL59937.1 MAG: hypothetical protein A2752_04480 [Candidatus Uhrbacteria bacterium RIFCSPHIGHO2_01_FULL_46_23]
MKVSLIITTLNEAETIGPLLDSISEQTLAPREIIIVDADSTDGTVGIIKDYSITPLRCYRGANRSVARNLGIKLAKNQIIAVTDAGCIADKHWLERLAKPFKDKRVLSVAGYYRPITKTNFQKCVAPFVAVIPDKFDPKTYLPSSRSLAFRKGTAWYPENLNYCEDLVFARELKTQGKMAVAKTALVNWQLPDTWRQFFRQIYHYAQGDSRARYRPHLVKIATVFGRYALFMFFPWLFLIYLFWPIFKFGRYTSTPGWKYLPLIQVTADIAVMTGSLSAIISRE